MADPVGVSDGGVSLRPELMERERMYHCFFGEKLLLFFKDSQDFLNCYEIEDPDLVRRARQTPEDGMEALLGEYARDAGQRAGEDPPQGLK